MHVLDTRLAQDPLPLHKHHGASSEVLRQHLLAHLVDRSLPDELHEHHEAPGLRDPNELSHRVLGLAVAGQADLTDGDVEDRVTIRQRIRTPGLELEPAG